MSKLDELYERKAEIRARMYACMSEEDISGTVQAAMDLNQVWVDIIAAQLAETKYDQSAWQDIFNQIMEDTSETTDETPKGHE